MNKKTRVKTSVTAAILSLCMSSIAYASNEASGTSTESTGQTIHNLPWSMVLQLFMLTATQI